jgi:hypothetical protein
MISAGTRLRPVQRLTASHAAGSHLQYGRNHGGIPLLAKRGDGPTDSRPIITSRAASRLLTQFQQIALLVCPSNGQTVTGLGWR